VLKWILGGTPDFKIYEKETVLGIKQKIACR